MEITVSHLYVNAKNRSILQDVSVFFPSGQLSFIAGSNGSGKSTLLKAIMGLVPYQGEIWVGNQLQSALSLTQQAQKIAYLPQHNVLAFSISVEAYLLMGRFPHTDFWRGYTALDHQKVADIATKLSLTPFLKRNMQTLSGGERQMVFFGRALIQNTPILLLDEPAHAFDPKKKENFYALLASLSLTQQQTIICTTHDVEVLQSNHPVVGMKAGNLILQSTKGVSKEVLWEKIYD